MDLGSVLKAQWDRFGAVACAVVGGLFLLFGWLGVSGTAYLADQVPYVISGGIGGVFFLGLGATLWISADLRDEWAKLDRIEDALRSANLSGFEAIDRNASPNYAPPAQGSASGHSDWIAPPVDLTVETPVLAASQAVDRAADRKTATRRVTAAGGQSRASRPAARVNQAEATASVASPTRKARSAKSGTPRNSSTTGRGASATSAARVAQEPAR